MRYFIFHPPTKSLKQIDVVDGTCVQEIIDMVQVEFGLRADRDGQGETSIVLNYNGSDLKPTLPLADLNVPLGAIIHCFYREKKIAHLHVHCGFNNQILELFDDTITNGTTIGEIRKKISDKIGLPLSTFCLETHDNKRRLYDQMKLFQYELKPHDHVYLKVWHGYEKFLNSCMKGFPKFHSNDDLSRHYELQIALHIAAFYGFMELAHSALQLGARSECPVGEHPCRQWSSETTVQDMREMLKCPIHIAVERGHMKMVDLFVRQSLLCTQAVHPITGFLPYRMALSLSLSAKTKAEKQRYGQIYLYLQDKQFNLKISLNGNPSNASSLLTSTTNISLLLLSWTHPVFFSLPRYCKIIRWYERARERVWKKHGIQFDSSVEVKRSYQSKGLLGYKVLIDGFNNSFDTSNEPICQVISDRKSKIDRTDSFIGYTNEERDKLLKMKAHIKQFGVDEQQGTKHATVINPKKSRRTPRLAQRGFMGAKLKLVRLESKNPSAPREDRIVSPKFSNSKDSPRFVGLDHQLPKCTTNTESGLHIYRSQSATAKSASLKPKKDQLGYNQKAKSMPKTICKTVVSTLISPPNSIINDMKEHEQQENYTLPPMSSSTWNASNNQSMWKEKIKMTTNTNITSNHPEEMSSTDAFLLSSARIAANDQQRKAVAKHELMAQIEQALNSSVEKPTTKTRLPSVQANHSIILDTDPRHASLPDHQTRKYVAPTRARFDQEIQHTILQPYERYASASIRATATDCLQDAGFFKKKSWLKQVEISKEMIKQRTKRRIRRADDERTNSVLSSIRIIDATPSPHTVQLPSSKVN